MLRKSGIPLALLLLLTISFFWKLVFTNEFTWFNHPDMANLEIPRMQFQARAIHDGYFPLWDPRIWAGQPLIGLTQPGPLYPLNLLFALMPLRDGHVRFDLLNWYWVVIHFLAALFCYLLARDLGRSRAAAGLAGMAFAFGGAVGSVNWLDVVNGAIWMPLIAMFLLRALRGYKPAASAALSGLFLGVAWLSGHHEIPMICSLAVALTWIFYIFRRGRPDFALARAAALSMLVAGLVGAAQILPTYEFGRHAFRWIGGGQPAVEWHEPIPYVVPASNSLLPRAQLSVFLANRTSEGAQMAFMGVLAVCAGVLAVVAFWRDWRVRWLVALGLLALVYAMGAGTPLHGNLSLLPALGKARVPVRAMAVFTFALAALVPFGFDALLDGREPRWVRRIALAAAGFGGLILGSAVCGAVFGQGAALDSVALAGWAGLAVAAIWLGLRAGQLSRVAGVIALGALMVVEMYVPSTGSWASRSDKSGRRFDDGLYAHDDIAAFLLKQPGPVRVHVSSEDIAYNFGDWHGIDMVYGYSAGVTKNIARHPFHEEPTQNLFGVQYLVAKSAARPDQQEVFQGVSGIKVFRNPRAMPRVWAVHEAVRAPDETALFRTFRDPAFDPARLAVMLSEPPALETCGGPDQVKLERHDPDRVAISVTMACRGMVVLSETMYPGWRAYVDGRSVPIQEAYGALRGVVVDAGKHDVDLRFRPLSVYGGLALSLAGVLIVIVAVRRRDASSINEPRPQD